MGTLFIYEEWRTVNHPNRTSVPNFGGSFYLISLPFNIILTLMIVVRLAMHDRSFRKITETRATAGRLYKAVITILIESCALHAVSFLLCVIPWSTGSSVTTLFYTSFTGMQVCTAFSFSRHAAILAHFYLIATNRSLPRSSSSFEWPTGPHRRAAALLSSGEPAQFISGVEGCLQAVTKTSQI